MDYEVQYIVRRIDKPR